jgi:hypothetical protein
MAVTEPAPLQASIAKFASLPRTKVLEQINVPWDQWLAFLAAEPADDFSGQMEHPGWSPVVYSPPKRERSHIKHVLALVLDYDKNATWDRVLALWAAHYGLLYTTKNHRDDAHRLRVVLPLSRPVTADEYDRLWLYAQRRSHAADLTPDGQAKDASRFWYDPTRPVGTWRSELLQGEPLDVEVVLAEPAQQPQPRLRVVTTPPPMTDDLRVRRARAYLARIPGAVAGQGGHTATFNAISHVMIGFDLTIEQTRSVIEDYNARCDPPWSEDEIEHKLTSISSQTKRTRGYLLTERPRIVDVRTAAQNAPAVPDELNVDWSSMMLRKADNTFRRCYTNVAVYVRHHPDYLGKWAIDTMTGQPWFDDEPMQPEMVHDIRSRVEERFGFTPSIADVEAAIVVAAKDRPFHPIQQYLRSLDWDGVPRLRTMAADYLGSDAEHHAEMVYRFMIGAAARVLSPGCKMDTALMLVGAQGIRKSSFFSVLGGGWHADTFIDITSKDGLLALHSAWFYEFAELENVVTGRAESRLKAFMTSTHDLVRVPYAKTMERRARSCVICGTTNRDQFLTDDTGSRRFWIVPVHQRIDVESLAAVRDQLWAEAVCAVEAGEPWWLSDDAARAVETHNDEHNEDDPWTEPVEQYVSKPMVTSVSTSEVLRLAIELETARQDRSAQTRVGRIMKRLGWRKCRVRRVYLYLRPGVDVSDVRPTGEAQ